MTQERDRAGFCHFVWIRLYFPTIIFFRDRGLRPFQISTARTRSVRSNGSSPSDPDGPKSEKGIRSSIRSLLIRVAKGV